MVENRSETEPTNHHYRAATLQLTAFFTFCGSGWVHELVGRVGSGRIKVPMANLQSTNTMQNKVEHKQIKENKYDLTLQSYSA